MNLLDDLRNRWQELEPTARLYLGYATIATLLIALCWSYIDLEASKLEKKLAARETVLKEMLPLKVAYTSVRQQSDELKGRAAALRPDDSLARIIEETGIKGRSLKLLPIKGEEKQGFVEEAAEIRVEGLTLNETLNLLYRLEKGRKPLVIRKANLRVRFDDPSRFDVTLVMALLKPLPGTAR